MMKDTTYTLPLSCRYKCAYLTATLKAYKCVFGSNLNRLVLKPNSSHFHFPCPYPSTLVPAEPAYADSYPSVSESLKRHVLKAHSSFQTVPRCSVGLSQLKVVLECHQYHLAKDANETKLLKTLVCSDWSEFIGIVEVILAKTGSSSYYVALVENSRRLNLPQQTEAGL